MTSANFFVDSWVEKYWFVDNWNRNLVEWCGRQGVQLEGDWATDRRCFVITRLTLKLNEQLFDVKNN